MLLELEEHRERLLRNLHLGVLAPLETLRGEYAARVATARRTAATAATAFTAAQDRMLALPAKTSETVATETAHACLDLRLAWLRAALDQAQTMQDVTTMRVPDLGDRLLLIGHLTRTFLKEGLEFAADGTNERELRSVLPRSPKPCPPLVKTPPPIFFF